MYSLLIALKPKTGESWSWSADLNRPDDLLPLHYEGQFTLQPELLLKTYDLRQYGRVLGEALFQGDLRDALTNALAQARQEGWLRVMLYIDQDAKELRSLHWERILAPIDGRWEFLALNQSTPFSLYLTSRSDRRYPPLPGDRMSMLLTIANPQNLEEYGLTPFDTAGTLDSLTQALGEMPVTVLTNGMQAASKHQVSGLPTLDGICQALTEGRHPLLHLVCHGRVVESSGETVLYLSADDAHTAPLTGSAWIERLAPLKNLPYLVFLSTCESADPCAESGLGGLAQRMVRELGIPAVLAMTGKVSIATAQALTGYFYHSLAEHGQPDRALGEALAGLAEKADFNMPALFTRLDEGKLFEPTEAISSEKISRQVERKPFEPEMVYIPSGSFWMGRDDSEGVPPQETPKARVELPAYFIGKYPITNREYAEYVRQTRTPVPVELGWVGRSPAKVQLDLPVRGVTWQEALDYCSWLNQQTGLDYTLPSEAQWECAARGNDGRLYPWGESWEDGRCNQGNPHTAAVAAFPTQSNFGLHDLVGNVLQWTTTLWGEKRLTVDYPYPWRPDDGREDINANSQVRRVLRGSSYKEIQEECICTRRCSYLPADRGLPGKRHGFRVVRSA